MVRALFQNYLVELELQITASPGFFLRTIREWQQNHMVGYGKGSEGIPRKVFVRSDPKLSLDSVRMLVW